MSRLLHCAARGIITTLLLSCTAIVNSRIDKFDADGAQDDAVETDVTAESDEEPPGDVLPDEEDADDITDLVELDFDPETCGVWGTISVPDPDSVGIDPMDVNRDGIGEMQIMILFPTKLGIIDSLGSVLYPQAFSLDFSIHEDNPFCIPGDFLTDNDAEDGWIMPFVYDNPIVESSEPNDFLTYQSLVVDPLTIIIAAATYRESDATDRALSTLYWNMSDPDNPMAIDLVRRASKFTGTVDFQDFPDSPVVNRRARLCVTVYGVREEDWYLHAVFPGEILGYNFMDLDDEDVEVNPPLYSFNVDFSAGTSQHFLVHAKYIENRATASALGGCGDDTRNASCARACYSLLEMVGTTFTGSVSLDITPPDGSSDPDCEVDLATLCP